MNGTVAICFDYIASANRCNIEIISDGLVWLPGLPLHEQSSILRSNHRIP